MGGTSKEKLAKNTKAEIILSLTSNIAAETMQSSPVLANVVFKTSRRTDQELLAALDGKELDEQEVRKLRLAEQTPLPGGIRYQKSHGVDSAAQQMKRLFNSAALLPTETNCNHSITSVKMVELKRSIMEQQVAAHAHDSADKLRTATSAAGATGSSFSTKLKEKYDSNKRMYGLSAMKSHRDILKQIKTGGSASAPETLEGGDGDNDAHEDTSEKTKETEKQTTSDAKKQPLPTPSSSSAAASTKSTLVQPTPTAASKSNGFGSAAEFLKRTVSEIDPSAVDANARQRSLDDQAKIASNAKLLLPTANRFILARNKQQQQASPVSSPKPRQAPAPALAKTTPAKTDPPAATATAAAAAAGDDSFDLELYIGDSVTTKRLLDVNSKYTPNKLSSSSSQKRRLNELSPNTTAATSQQPSSVSPSSTGRDSKKQKLDELLALARSSAHAKEVMDPAKNPQLRNCYEQSRVQEMIDFKLAGVRKRDVALVSCAQCAYTAFKQSDFCRAQRHDIRRHQGVQRFFKCKACKRISYTLDEIVPSKACRHCGGDKLEPCGMRDDGCDGVASITPFESRLNQDSEMLLES